MNENLPKNPLILLSYINLNLRDHYSSLDALCDDLDVDKDELVKTLREAGFEYSEEQNRFW
ncbi:MAG: DUF4250 domain-containing protein [Muribaculaceae bacterium]